jgi:cholesterol oxidase
VEPDYDVLIIGSGFGGSITALRLTEKGYRVGVLEAGPRYADEDFAKTSWNLRKFLWAPQLGCYGIQRIHLLQNCMILAGAGVGCMYRRSRSSTTSSGHTSPIGARS